MATCDICGRERDPREAEYDPALYVAYGLSGWYSGNDGEICAEDLKLLMANQ